MAKKKKNTEIKEAPLTLADMTPEQKDAFADRLLRQLMDAEESAKKGRTKEDVVVIDLTDFAEYKTPLTLYDESEYTVRKYLVHDDVAKQFSAFVDTAVRLDEFYKLDLLIDSKDIDKSEVFDIMKEILYTPGNVQGSVIKHSNKEEAEYIEVIKEGESK